MGKQANELIKKFGGDYTYEQVRKLKGFDLAKVQYEYPESAKGNTFSELEEIAKDGDADAKKAIKLLLQTNRLNAKSGQN